MSPKTIQSCFGMYTPNLPTKKNTLFPPSSRKVFFFVSSFFLFLNPSLVFAQVKNTPHSLEIFFEETSSVEKLTEIIYGEWLSFDFFLTPSSQESDLAHPYICQNSHLLCTLESTQRNSFYRKIQRTTSINESLVQKYLEKLQEKYRQEPQNAKFELTSDFRVKTFLPASSGWEIDIEKSTPLLSEAIIKSFSEKTSSSFTLISKEILPQISSSDAESFGIISLIGEGRSNFLGSSQDRIFNIQFGLEKFHGTLIKPGEEFSFVKILGEVDEKNGWKPELVIRNNRTEPEYGGGICQVSTTLFRSAVFSGLRITMRQNHSYPVKYYQPIGFDASIYVPMPDLRFINNTPGHILIQGEIIENELVFRLYGTNDGRKTHIEDPVILEKKDDGSIKTVFTQKVFDEQENLLFEKSFFSNYDNPANYPKTEDIDLTEKPKDWSKKQWEKYKKEIEASLKNQ